MYYTFYLSTTNVGILNSEGEQHENHIPPLLVYLLLIFQAQTGQKYDPPTLFTPPALMQSQTRWNERRDLWLLGLSYFAELSTKLLATNARAKFQERRDSILTTSSWAGAPSWSCSSEPACGFCSQPEWGGTWNLYPINTEMVRCRFSGGKEDLLASSIKCWSHKECLKGRERVRIGGGFGGPCHNNDDNGTHSGGAGVSQHTTP